MTIDDRFAPESGNFALDDCARGSRLRLRRRWLTRGRAATPLLVLLAALFASAGAMADIRYVDDDAPPGGDGLTWPTAYRYLQDALFPADFELDITEIRVAEGSYFPDLSENWKVFAGNRSESFRPRDSDLILAGGYRGLSGGGLPDDRNIALFETILSGDLDENDAPGGFTGNEENSYHVVTIFAADNTLRVDGFTIERGNTLGDDGTSGGGLYNSGALAPGGRSNPVIVDCQFTLNFAGSDGGGSYSNVGDPTYLRCTFVNNDANRGGGLFLDQSDAVVDTCTFDDNSATDGAGLYCRVGAPAITDSLFDANVADGSGGGIYAMNVNGTIENTEFIGNFADNEGAGLRCDAATMDITRGEFSMNVAGGLGGAIYDGFASGGTITGTTFDANMAGDGGGLALCGGSRTLSSCVIRNHTASGFGGGIFLSEGASASLDGCTVRNNASNSSDGGGLAACGSSFDIVGGVFDGNSSGGRGGAIFDDGASPNVKSVLFDDNSSAIAGGAIAQIAGASVYSDCFFIRNAAPLGGAFYQTGGLTNIVSSAFTLNKSLSGLARGGAIAVDNFSTLNIANGVFTENSAIRGGALYSNASNTEIDSSSFSGNVASNGGALYLGLGESPQGGGVLVQNSILWGDVAASEGDEVFNTGVFAAFTNCDVQGSGGSGKPWDVGIGADLGGNIDEDPLFFGPGEGGIDLRLNYGSPAIDAGANFLLPLDVADLDGDKEVRETLPLDRDGNPRIDNFTVDMGAFESMLGGACCFSGGVCNVISEIDCDKSGGDYLGDGTECFGGACDEVLGACCISDTCVDNILAGDCFFGMGGDFFFPGFTCADGVCGNPDGACCYDGDVCDDTSAFICAKSGGVFQGEDVSCEVGLCADPVGACCLTGGSCLDATQENECNSAGGMYQGDATTCGGVMCPPLPPIVFQPPTETLAFDEPVIEKIADLDNDGDPDVVIVIPTDNPGPQPGYIQVFRNRGIDGGGVWLGFDVLAPIPVGPVPTGITAGLLDDDLFVDLAVTNSGDDSVSFVMNDASGNATFFAAVHVFLPSLNVPSAIAHADFTGNGRNDIIVANLGSDEVVLYENLGVPPAPGGSGNPPQFQFRDADCVGEDPVGVCPEDLDQDRDIDALAVSFSGGRLGGLMNDPDLGPGGNIFQDEVAIPVGAGPRDVAVADFNGDGLPDIVSANSLDNTLTLVINQGGFNFNSSTPPIPVGVSPRAVAAGDFDGDSDPDIVVAADDAMIGPAVQVLKNTYADNGLPNLIDETAHSVGANPVWVAVADLNLDGVPDIVSSNIDDGGTGGSVTGLLNSPCPSDIDGDGMTGFSDLIQLLASWGVCPGCPQDLNSDGVVGMQDLLLLLFLWGGCS